jgi:hypothetical protein
MVYVIQVCRQLESFKAITNLMHKYLYSYNITILYMFLDHYYAHLQEVKLSIYSIWYRHSLCAAERYTSKDRSSLYRCNVQPFSSVH